MKGKNFFFIFFCFGYKTRRNRYLLKYLAKASTVWGRDWWGPSKKVLLKCATAERKRRFFMKKWFWPLLKRNGEEVLLGHWPLFTSHFKVRRTTHDTRRFLENILSRSGLNVFRQRRVTTRNSYETRGSIAHNGKSVFPASSSTLFVCFATFPFGDKKKFFFLSPAFSFNFFFFFAFFLCFPCVNFLFYACYVLFAGFNSFSIYSIRTLNASLIKNFPLRFISLFFIFLFS